MGNFTQVGKASDLENGAMTEVLAQGHTILLVRVGNKYYAADNRCPHLGGTLSKGKLEGTVVTCPQHKSQFDLSDGHVVRWLGTSGVISKIGKVFKSPKPLRLYNIRIDDDKILIET